MQKLVKVISTETTKHSTFLKRLVFLKVVTFIALPQGDQIGQNFTIWAIFYGKIFSRKNRPMIWAKFWP